MHFLIIIVLSLLSLTGNTDTIDHYMSISNDIPKMEMKTDQQAQVWARSARNVLTLTNESIAETLMQANELAKSQGHPLFCLPAGTVLNAATLNRIILQTYKDISSQQSDKDKMTVSQVAWIGLTKTFPCKTESTASTTPFMQHSGTAP